MLLFHDPGELYQVSTPPRVALEALLECHLALCFLVPDWSITNQPDTAQSMSLGRSLIVSQVLSSVQYIFFFLNAPLTAV